MTLQRTCKENVPVNEAIRMVLQEVAQRDSMAIENRPVVPKIIGSVVHKLLMSSSDTDRGLLVARLAMASAATRTRPKR
jgi:hypothetical protein